MDVDTAIYDASIACVQEQVGNDISAVLAGSASLAGQNWVDVGGKFAGATSGTSLISQFLSEALPQQLPVALPTFTNAGLKFTPILGRVIGRWVPIVGISCWPMITRTLRIVWIQKFRWQRRASSIGTQILKMLGLVTAIGGCLLLGIIATAWFKTKTTRLARSRQHVGLPQFLTHFSQKGIPTDVATAVYEYLSNLPWMHEFPV